MYSSNYNDNAGRVDKQVSQILVPLGLRFGVRGSTDGGFVGFYTALGYQVGGGKRLYTPPGATPKTKYTETTSFAFTVGLAYGIG